MDRGNNMNRAKRILDGNNDDDQPERKRPALASVIVEALKVDSLQKLCSSLEPILRRVVSEEVERALAKLAPARLTGSSGSSSPKRIEGPDGRKLRLHFKSRLSLPLFTGGKVEGEQGAAIHVVLIDANTGRAVVYGPEASAKLQVVVLEGDFNSEDDEDWTQEEFESHVVKERAGKRPLLTGDVYVTLKEGVGTLGELVFTDNSSWIRSRKFRLGLRVVTGYCDGMRIREAKTEAFIVKDHRGELYKKHYPPALADEVWRLEKIGKDGAFHKKLNAEGIDTVEDFLRVMVKDSGKLRTILGSGMSNKMWDALVEHAKTCVQSSKLYIYYAEDSRNVGVVFNNIYELSGLISGDQYFSAESLTDSQKVYVDGLVKRAYENWTQVIEYDGKSILDLKQPNRLSITQTDLANYSTAPIDHPIQMVGHSSSMPANQSPVLSDFAIGGYDQSLATRYHSQPQLLNSNPRAHFDVAACSNPRAQFDVASCSTTQDQLLGNLHQSQSTINSQNMNGLALGPPQSSTNGYQNINSASVHQANLNHLEDWSNPRERGGPEDFFSEEEIRLRSHEMLESEDMQQFLRLFSMGGGGNGSATHLPEDGYTFPSFLHTPMQGYDEDRGRSGRAVVGWLKIKAAMRWGFFIRRKAAERRAQIVELDDDDEDGE
ncbi:PREDICTED: calmodulin-binding protein 60 B [Camelina sativa]|uniref:Calmodulin-binding protein 60 B n=1 Tax=Camelina sativa TaxID=90675 RepID=A0ABM0XB01_CAMSA|nr:PREDICTED: calmodulin-binding protein 60 B [Camelina sativa]XP_010483283.1 PREDICTED: calmodulin-binding protein 60 B [Camelina sativa]XP_010483284.1 PREDICTED: calmodulin-binding protein 60 B [Camelina sativa]XP_010483285.1 PREDICTED: calmodulin-binding protein 60 B [Camelina sativa]XP_010483286.1 PREDICTED: calmodulin-binding protein 60 B [Camelina sativa]XP_010483287.1 PREDICTED: calmodulin-binding protein 60 B [Camelina sativa]